MTQLFTSTVFLVFDDSNFLSNERALDQIRLNPKWLKKSRQKQEKKEKSNQCNGKVYGEIRNVESVRYEEIFWQRSSLHE